MTPAEIAWIQQVIANSGLGLLPNAPGNPGGPLTNTVAQGVFVANPSPALNTSGINKAPIGLISKFPIKIAPQVGVGGTTAADALDWGISLAKRSSTYLGFHGYCAGFALVTAAILVAKDTQLLPTRVVEQISSGNAASGHTYLVIDRDPASAINGPVNAWGDNCVIVDQWYALQTGTLPTKRTATYWAQQPVNPANALLQAADSKFATDIDAYGAKNLIATFAFNVLTKKSNL